MTNQERVGKGLELLREELAPYVEREVDEAVRAGTMNMETVRRHAEDPLLKTRPIAGWDAAGLLKLMWETWNDVFRRTLGFAERSLVSELRNWRNKWAHQEPFSSDDADRAPDSRLTGADAPALRAGKKLRGDELPLGKPGGTVLRRHLDAVAGESRFRTPTCGRLCHVSPPAPAHRAGGVGTRHQRRRGAARLGT